MTHPTDRAATTETKHTETPWHVASQQPHVIVNEGGNLWIARGLIGHGNSPRFGHDRSLAEANAAFIVEAVNAYDDLRAQLAAATKRLRTLADCANAIRGADPYDPDAEEAYDMFESAMREARAFLASNPTPEDAG